MDAVIAGKRREAHVGYDEPLRRQRAVFIIAAGARPLRRRRHHIDAGLQLADRLVDRECRGDVGIQGQRRRQLAAPYLDAALGAQAVELVTAQRGLEVAADHGVDEVAIADPEYVDAHRLGVDRDQRDALLAAARQHIGAAGEAHEGLAVADIDIELGRFRQALLHRRGQAGAQIDGVALAMPEALDAELLVFAGDRRPVAAGKCQIRREIDALGEVFGELEAGPRRGGIRVDGVIQQLEAALVAQLFVLPADVGDLAQLQRQPQRIERRAPQLAVGHRAAEHGQGFRLLAGIAGALIGDIGRGRGALQQEGRFGRGRRADLEDRLGQPQPVGAVFRRSCHDLAERGQSGAGIVAPERGVGIAAQCRRRLRDRPGLALDLRFQLDGGIVEVIAPECLVGGHSLHHPDHQSRAKADGANQNNHRKLPARTRPNGIRCESL